jgi:glutaredoxin 3
VTALELFGAASCPFTTELREHLQWEGRAFVEHDVERDPASHARLVSLTGARSVPVLVEDGRVVTVGWRGRACQV